MNLKMYLVEHIVLLNSNLKFKTQNDGLNNSENS